MNPIEVFGFSGVNFQIVPAGTVVTDERSGGKIEITDTQAAVKGRVMWVTLPMWEALRAKAREAQH